MAMPDRFRREYDEIPRTEIGVEIAPTPLPVSQPVFVSVKEFAQKWALNIMTAVILILIPVMVSLIFAVAGLRSEVKAARQDLLDSKVRGCALLAQSSTYFPPSCLDPDVVSIYAHDLIDALDKTGVQGANRRALCRAQEDQGVRDTDCQE